MKVTVDAEDLFHAARRVHGYAQLIMKMPDTAFGNPGLKQSLEKEARALSHRLTAALDDQLSPAQKNRICDTPTCTVRKSATIHRLTPRSVR